MKKMILIVLVVACSSRREPSPSPETSPPPAPTSKYQLGHESVVCPPPDSPPIEYPSVRCTDPHDVPVMDKMGCVTCLTITRGSDCCSFGDVPPTDACPPCKIQKGSGQ